LYNVSLQYYTIHNINTINNINNKMSTLEGNPNNVKNIIKASRKHLESCPCLHNVTYINYDDEQFTKRFKAIDIVRLIDNGKWENAGTEDRDYFISHSGVESAE